ncbi:MAG: hypothetical protein K8R50_05350 [Betaproteobacteria bacterium]|nr:hypothetical protein [Betaproteobacteria bacterium]
MHKLSITVYVGLRHLMTQRDNRGADFFADYGNFPICVAFSQNSNVETGIDQRRAAS